MSRFLPTRGVSEFAFQEETGEVGGKLIRKGCFFLNPSSAEAPFLLKKNLCFFCTASAIT